MSILELFIYILLFILFCLFLGGFRVINQYENAVRLRFGKFKDVLFAGLKWIIPFVDYIERIDIRQRTIDLASQEVLSKDNVNLRIDGILFYIISNPKSSFLNVKNIKWQLEAKATSELKEIIGSITMQEALTQREKIAKDLKDKINDAIRDKEGNKDWGVVIKGVQINNIELPQQLVRAMAKTAEAEREKQSRIIKAEGEFEASRKFSDASKLFKNNYIALRLRELQTYQEIGTEHNSLIIVVPEKQLIDIYGLAALGKDMIDKNKTIGGKNAKENKEKRNKESRKEES